MYLPFSPFSPLSPKTKLQKLRIPKDKPNPARCQEERNIEHISTDVYHHWKFSHPSRMTHTFNGECLKNSDKPLKGGWCSRRGPRRKWKHLDFFFFFLRTRRSRESHCRQVSGTLGWMLLLFYSFHPPVFPKLFYSPIWRFPRQGDCSFCAQDQTGNGYRWHHSWVGKPARTVLCLGDWGVTRITLQGDQCLRSNPNILSWGWVPECQCDGLEIKTDLPLDLNPPFASHPVPFASVVQQIESPGRN